MPFIKTNDGTEIFYKDWGKGQPLVFSHGWPLSADDWDTQMLFFLSPDYRVIAHDRRSHGRLRPGAGMSIWRPAVRRASVDAEARAVPAANREQDAALGG